MFDADMLTTDIYVKYALIEALYLGEFHYIGHSENTHCFLRGFYLATPAFRKSVIVL